MIFQYIQNNSKIQNSLIKNCMFINKDYQSEFLFEYLTNYNLLCNNLYLFQTNAICRNCGNTTEVVCLATDDAQILYDNELYYKKDLQLKLLSYVYALPDDLACYLDDKFNYKYSALDRDVCISNHCKYCGCIQDDNMLHNIFDGLFYRPLLFECNDVLNYYKIKIKEFDQLYATNTKYKIRNNF